MGQQYIDFMALHDRVAKPLPALHKRHIGTREGCWLATLKGRNPEHLQARARRFCEMVIGARILTNEELDTCSRLSREGFTAEAGENHPTEPGETRRD